MHENESNPVKLFELGIVAPALVVGLLNAKQINVPQPSINQITSNKNSDSYFNISPVKVVYADTTYKKNFIKEKAIKNESSWFDQFLQGFIGKKPESCVFPDAPSSTAPDWICGAPQKGNITAVGIGQTKIEAISNALSSLSRQRESSVASSQKKFIDSEDASNDDHIPVMRNEELLRSISKTYFGKIEVLTMQKSFTFSIENASENDFEKSASLTTRILLKNGKCNFEVKLHREWDKLNIVEKYISVTEKGCTLKDFTKELERAGVKIYSSIISPESNIYLMLGVNSEAFDKISTFRKEN